MPLRAMPAAISRAQGGEAMSGREHLEGRVFIVRDGHARPLTWQEHLCMEVADKDSTIHGSTHGHDAGCTCKACAAAHQVMRGEPPADDPEFLDGIMTAIRIARGLE